MSRNPEPVRVQTSPHDSELHSVTIPEESELLRQMLRIRLFEERVLEEFSRGHLGGTTHTCIGQEANAVGVLCAADGDDVVVSNHRGHGHFLAHGGDMRALAAELMGKASGVCGGVGGSQHLHLPNFYSNGVLGSTIPCAAGLALAQKTRRTGKIVIVFLGDGMLGEGVVYESLNLASLWRLPIVFVVENNGYAQTTPIRLALAGDVGDRFRAFGIEATEVDTRDVKVVLDAASSVLGRVREHGVPQALVITTYRLAPHSKGDDTRDEAEIAHHRERGPIAVLSARLSEPQIAQAREAAARDVALAFAQALEDPWPSSGDLDRVTWGRP